MIRIFEFDALKPEVQVADGDAAQQRHNGMAVPQMPERCLSRKAGIVRCCPE